jgi:hypothetical protein
VLALAIKIVIIATIKTTMIAIAVAVLIGGSEVEVDNAIQVVYPHDYLCGYPQKPE